MNREQLAHILRAASMIVDDPHILVIGSRSVLATFDEDELAVMRTSFRMRPPHPWRSTLPTWTTPQETG